MNWQQISSLIDHINMGCWDNINDDNVNFTNTSQCFVKNGAFIVNEKSLPYINEAIKNGVTVAIIDKNFSPELIEKITIPIFQVNNINELFNTIKTFSMKNHPLKIGITGSAGKTTVTKNLSYFLSNYYNVATNMRNYNTPMGINLSLSSQKEPKEIYIYEMGISKPGDMGLLTNVFDPTLVIILPVKSGHSENFNDYNHLLQEKLSIINPSTKYCITLKQYEEKVKDQWPNINFLTLEEFYPKNWKIDQWNNSQVYDEFIENIGYYIINNIMRED